MASRLIVLMVVIVIVILLLYLTTKKSKPVTTSRYPEMLKFMSQTVPKNVLDLYLKGCEVFKEYGTQLGYKFKDGRVTWEFYSIGNIEITRWLQLYNQSFPQGVTFKAPALNQSESVFCISMDLNEEVANLGHVKHLNLYTMLDYKPKYVYLLTPNGELSLKGSAVYNVPAKDLESTSNLGIEPRHATQIRQWIKNEGWFGKQYGFVQKDQEIGLYVYNPSPKTVTSYFSKLHKEYDPKIPIKELAVHFREVNGELVVHRDAFYIV